MWRDQQEKAESTDESSYCQRVRKRAKVNAVSQKLREKNISIRRLRLTIIRYQELKDDKDGRGFTDATEVARDNPRRHQFQCTMVENEP